jgi:hypothetical protein
MIISKQQSADGTCPEDNRKLNRFEIESDEQCEQWLFIYNGKMVKKTKQQKLFKQPYLEQRFFELVKSPYWFDIRH